MPDKQTFNRSVKKKSGGPVLLDNRMYCKGAVIKINIRMDKQTEGTKYKIQK